MRLLLYHFLSLTFSMKMKGVKRKREEHRQVFMALFRASEESFDGAMKGGQSFFAFRKRKINEVISAGRDDVEFWIEHIDTMHDLVEPRKCEGSVALVLPHSVLDEIKKNYKS